MRWSGEKNGSVWYYFEFLFQHALIPLVAYIFLLKKFEIGRNQCIENIKGSRSSSRCKLWNIVKLCTRNEIAWCRIVF